jgi:hypothetical protein
MQIPAIRPGRDGTATSHAGAASRAGGIEVRAWRLLMVMPAYFFSLISHFLWQFSLAIDSLQLA